MVKYYHCKMPLAHMRWLNLRSHGCLARPEHSQGGSQPDTGSQLFVVTLREPLGFFFLNILFIYIWEWGREWEREVEKHQSVVSHAPQLGIEPATLACALIGNWTGELLLGGTMSHQWSHTDLGTSGMFDGHLVGGEVSRAGSRLGCPSFLTLWSLSVSTVKNG